MKIRSTMITMVAVAGLVLALAPGAMASSITIGDPLIPVGLVEGDTFHLVFVTPTGIAATSTDIAVYNAHVQSAAASAGLGGWTWNAVASTLTVNANVNAPVSADVYLTRTGVMPKVANVGSFYGSGNLVKIDYNPDGNQHTRVDESPHQYDSSPTWAVWTGTQLNGTRSMELGRTTGLSTYGYANINAGQDWIRWQHDGAQTGQEKLLPLYGLSEQLTVIPEPGTIALLGLAGLAMMIRRRFVK